MTQEEKQLLLKDLAARLPYNVVIRCTDSDTDYKCFLTTDILNELLHGTEYYDYRPYLRPMSSMKEEELKELNEKYRNIAYFFIQEPPYYHGLQAQHSDIGSIEISEFSEIYNWLNEHHFDYRGLIPMGLALEAPANMYKTE